MPKENPASPNNISFCGPNEPCFEKGECWGHMEESMCKHLDEKPNNQAFCNKTQKNINHIYTKTVRV